MVAGGGGGGDGIFLIEVTIVRLVFYEYAMLSRKLSL